MNNEKGKLVMEIRENLNAMLIDITSSMLDDIALGVEMELDDDENSCFETRDKERIEELVEAKNEKDMDFGEILWKLNCIEELQSGSELGKYIDDEYELTEIVKIAIEDTCGFLKISSVDRDELIDRIIKFLEREKSGIEDLAASAIMLENIINDFEQALLERKGE